MKFYKLICILYISIFLIIVKVPESISKYCQINLSNARLSTLLDKLVGCTFINGFLEIQLDAKTDIFDNRLKAFDEIEYVTDYIHIWGAFGSPRPFSMKNLRAIYGERLYKNNYSLYFDQTKGNITEFDFRSLSVISRGNVGFNKNFDFCNATEIIYWSEIFSSSSQKVEHSEYNLKQHLCTPEKKSIKNCHENCTIIANNQSYCYGSEIEQCQKTTRCTKRPCKRCYFDETFRSEECCHYLCAGGCVNASESGCFACTGVSYKGVCLESCNENTYQISKICVDSCPPNTAVYDKSCVDRCPDGYVNNNGICEPCGSTGCPKACNLFDPNGNHYEHIDRTKLFTLKNCSRVDGSIIINTLSFRKMDGNDPILYVDDFMAMSNLKYIEGILALNLVRLPQEMKNDKRFESLFFLKNLEVVNGQATANIKAGPGFTSVPFVYLGLTSLKKFNVTSINFLSSPNLKYGETTVNWKKLSAKKTSNNASFSPALCDPLCHKEWGCMGPGPAQCLRCKDWKISSEVLCIENCSSRVGYFTPQKTPVDLNEEQICESCHQECAEGCVGAGPLNCTGACANLRVNKTGECVATCPRDTFLSSDDNKTCIDCHPNCHRRRPGQSICTGPRDSDCLKCNTLMLVPNTIKPQGCSFGNNCPSAHYSIDSTILNDPDISRFAEADELMIACGNCMENCGTCSSASSCDFCNGQWQDDQCVKGCSLEKVPEKDKLNIDKLKSNATCPKCHSLCFGTCKDSSESGCYKCQSAFVKNNSQTICYDVCPEKTIRQSNGECLLENATKEYKQKNMINIIVICVVVAFLILFIIFIICAITLVKKKRELKKELEKKKVVANLFCNAYENPDYVYDTLVSGKPNLNRLEIINADDLHFEETNYHRLGKGAFGEVFLAKWSVSEDTLNRRRAESTLFAQTNTSPSSPTSISSSTFSTKTTFQLEVAVKMITDVFSSESKEHFQELLEEAKIMASVKHPHCLPLVGVCLSEGRQSLITAYMPMGSMDRYLRDYGHELSAYTLFLWSQQIADGMQYLSYQGIIHRDLATRNVLLKDSEWAMITDFGLSKMLDTSADKEVIIRAGRVPIRWLAVETLRKGIYSEKTDVWAYGVTLWEIFTLGEVPYKELETTAVRTHVLKGDRLSCPLGCHQALYKEMLICWNDDPDSRPDFKALKNKMKNFSTVPEEYFTADVNVQFSDNNNGQLRDKNRRGRRPGRKLDSNISTSFKARYLGESTYVDMRNKDGYLLPSSSEDVESQQPLVSSRSDDTTDDYCLPQSRKEIENNLAVITESNLYEEPVSPISNEKRRFS